MGEQLTRERITAIIFYACVLVIAYMTYLVIAPFLTPLAWAAIFAAFFHPQFKQLRNRFGKSSAALISTIAVALIVIIPFSLIVTLFVQQAAQVIGHLDLSPGSPGMLQVQRIWAWAQKQPFGSRLGSLEDTLQQNMSWLTGHIAIAAGDILKNVVSMFVHLVISIFAMFFFFRDGEFIMEKVRRILPFDASFSESQIQKSTRLIRASIGAIFAIAIVQGTLGGVTFALLGLNAPIFWGVMLAFFALFPFGGGVVWLPIAVWLLLTGHIGRGLILIAVGGGVIGMVDNFLRPYILSGRAEMNGLLVFISLLGGLAAFGFVGLVLKPIILAFAAGFLDAYATERRQLTGLRIAEPK